MQATGLLRRFTAALRLPSLLAIALSLPQAACFGTGVTAGTDATESFEVVPERTMQRTLAVSVVLLSPPAPATTLTTWTNLSHRPVTIDGVNFPSDASIRWDFSSCNIMPLLPQLSCSVAVTANGNAIAGTYRGQILHHDEVGARVTPIEVTIEPGQLVLNDNQPLAIDGANPNATYPVRIENQGFDSISLTLTASSLTNPSAFSVDANDCSAMLPANQSCTALLNVSQPSCADTAVLTADDGRMQRQASVGISVASLAVANVAVTTTGTTLVTLANLGGSPLSVVRADLFGLGVTDLSLPVSAAALAACQNVSGNCQLPLMVGPQASAADNVATINILYSKDGASHRFSTGVLVDNRTSASVAPVGQPLLPSANGTLRLAVNNTGPFVLQDMKVALSPPLSDVTALTTCGYALPPGSSCIYMLSSGSNVVEGATSAVSLTADNLPGPAMQPVSVATSLLIAGTDAASGGNDFLAASYNGGASYALRPQHLVNASWQAGMMVGDTWTVVGDQQGYQTSYTSRDRGFSWTSATMPQGSGGLHAVVGRSGLYLTAGNEGPQAMYRTSTDDGETWGPQNFLFPLPNWAPSSANGVASNGTAWVIVGTADSNYFIASSTDDLASVQTMSPGPGALFAVAWNGSHWLAVGADSSGNPLILKNELTTADPGTWTGMTTLGSGPATLRAIATDDNAWLVVGEAGGNRIAMLGLTSGTTFPPWQILGPGQALAAAYHENVYKVAGIDSAANQGVVDVSSDLSASSWSSTLIDGSASLMAIVAH